MPPTAPTSCVARRASSCLRSTWCGWQRSGARAHSVSSPKIGTIEKGKRADVIVLNLDDAQLIPNTNYFETIVYRAKSRNLTHTIVNGRIVYADGRLQLADQEDLLADGRQAAAEWLHRSEATWRARALQLSAATTFRSRDGDL